MAGIIKNFMLKIILENAIEAEEKAYDFYEKAIPTTAEEKAKELLRNLAGEELKHRLKLEETQREGNLGKLTVEKPDTVKTIETFADEWPLITPDTTSQEILEIALEKEKRAYSFYSILRDHASLKAIKQIFDGLAAEERRHIDWVSTELERKKSETTS